MAETQNNQKPFCCDPHHKYHKQLKFLAIKVVLVDLVLVFTAIVLLCASKYFVRDIDTVVTEEEHALLYSIGCTLGVIGLFGIVATGLVGLVLSIVYHVHNAHDLHGKKDSKGNKPVTKKSKK